VLDLQGRMAIKVMGCQWSAGRVCNTVLVSSNAFQIYTGHFSDTFPTLELLDELEVDDG
jgi:hypothetical protein